ncbi:hypothetical protein CCR75_002282 [Bremia lactucae]|uniref:RRM domain-containing protein n=1 Tax=Bremia lactucae TaxID=4779 RepID=A0A976IEX6_BRELC|nr:hypothetical protein CCR75_002282 [Bremia lactucae]
MARVYVGNLPENVRERDLTDRFERFGALVSINIKFPVRPPPFAHMNMKKMQVMHTRVICFFAHLVASNLMCQWEKSSTFAGSRIRVEISRGTTEPRPRGTQYRVKITGLPDAMSWQDLKDFLRKGGDVVHSDVDHRGSGTASFATPDEMRRAIRKLDGADVNGERVRIRQADVGRHSRSPSHSKSRSPPRRSSRHPSRSRSRSLSRSPRRYSSRPRRRDHLRSRSR